MWLLIALESHFFSDAMILSHNVIHCMDTNLLCVPNELEYMDSELKITQENDILIMKDVKKKYQGICKQCRVISILSQN